MKLLKHIFLFIYLPLITLSTIQRTFSVNWRLVPPPGWEASVGVQQLRGRRGLQIFEKCSDNLTLSIF